MAVMIQSVVVVVEKSLIKISLIDFKSLNLFYWYTFLIKDKIIAFK